MYNSEIFGEMGGRCTPVFNFQNKVSRMSSTLYKELRAFGINTWESGLVQERKRKWKITKFSHISKFSATIIHFMWN